MNPIIDEESEDYADVEESSDKIDIFNTPLSVGKYGDNMNVSYYFKNIRQIIPELINFSFNRELNEKHKNKIKDDLLKQKCPHLMGSIQIIKDLSNNYRVINGQHRLFAIKEILDSDTNMNFNINILFEVYDVNLIDINSIENNYENINDLFEKANNSLNFKALDDRDLFIRSLLLEIKKDPILGPGIVEKDKGRVNKPRILLKNLFELFKVHFKIDNKLSIDKIVEKIKIINNTLSLKNYNEFYGTEKVHEKKLKQRNKAFNIGKGFYLNLDSKFPPEVWIKMIHQ